MKALQFILTITLLSGTLLSGIAGAAVPDWVQPGATATYDMYSSALRNGQPYNAVHALVTFEVDSVSEEGVAGTVYIYNPTTGMTTTQQVNCPEGGVACLGRFWLDTADPVNSIKGETGVTYRVAGSGPLEVAGQSWDATVLQYKDSRKGIDFHLNYDTQSGLILSYGVKWPNQQLYMYLNSWNTDPALDVLVDPADDY